VMKVSILVLYLLSTAQSIHGSTATSPSSVSTSANSASVDSISGKFFNFDQRVFMKEFIFMCVCVCV
jgi:hypothetical protein